MKPSLLSVCALIMSAYASFADDQTTDNDDFKTLLAVKARKELTNFASNILAATICKDAKFNSDSVVPLMIGVRVALDKEEAQSTFFDAIRNDLTAIHDRGESSWCAETLKAAKNRHSEMLTSDDAVRVEPEREPAPAHP